MLSASRTTRCPTTASSSSPAAASSSPTRVEDAIEARHGRALGSARPAPTSAASDAARGRARAATSSHLLDDAPAPAGRAARRRRLRQRRRVAHVAPEALRRAGAEVVAIARRAGRLEHQRRLRLDAPRTRCAAAVLEHGADVGHRARRRRRPLPGRRRRRRDRRRRPDPGRARARACASAGALADDTVVATVMSQPRLPAGDAARGHHASSRPRSATATCSRRCATAATRSAASSPATSSCSTTPPPATAC